MDEIAHEALSASVALLTGYIFIKTSLYRRFSTAHLRADRFALDILGHALFFVALGAGMAEIVPDWTHGKFAAASESVSAFGITAVTVNAALLALLFGIASNIKVLLAMRNDAAVKSIRRRWTVGSFIERARMAAISLYVRRSNDAALRTLFRAVILKKLVMFTLKNGKVYVGQALFNPDDPSDPIKSLRIVPIASGSRHGITKKVNFSTKYAALASSLTERRGNIQRADKADPFISATFDLHIKGREPAPIDIEDIGVVIIWSEVHTLTLYDQNIYDWFQQQPEIGENQGPAALEAPLPHDAHRSQAQP